MSFTFHYIAILNCPKSSGTLLSHNFYGCLCPVSPNVSATAAIPVFQGREWWSWRRRCWCWWRSLSWVLPPITWYNWWTYRQSSPRWLSIWAITSPSVSAMPAAASTLSSTSCWVEISGNACLKGKGEWQKESTIWKAPWNRALRRVHGSSKV